MTFHKQPFSQRFGQLGDEAEGIFEAVHPKGFARFGINRPPIQLGNVPKRIRYAPDYLTSDGLIEVKGCGRDQLLKIKLENWNCLMFWHQVFQTQLFVWDTTNKRYTYVELSVLEDLFNQPESGISFKHFDDPKGYFAIPLAAFPDDWATTEEFGLAA